jgi:hypothetical protein
MAEWRVLNFSNCERWNLYEVFVWEVMRFSIDMDALTGIVCAGCDSPAPRS